MKSSLQLERTQSILFLMRKRRPKKKSVSKKQVQNSKKRTSPPPKSNDPVHPWRACPYGEHWVTVHPLNVPPSKTHPEGALTTRHGHCAHNPSRKDQLYPDEIREIANRHFLNTKNKPCPLSLKFPNGSKFDDLIAGWTQYWNEVLQPAEPLDPNFVKALIATESGFNPNLLANKKNQKSARGLMQILDATRKILDDGTGEIKDHYITATRSDLNEPSINICAGIR